MNTNYASWKLLQAKVTKWIRKNAGEVPTELGQVSVDEIAEASIFDAVTDEDRRLQNRKRTRKIFVGEPISVYFSMTNDLLVDCEIQTIHLVA